MVHSPSLISDEEILSQLNLVSEEGKLIAALPSFKKAGYYDWRFITINFNGDRIPLTLTNKKLSQVQGRVIVHPNIRDEFMHESNSILNKQLF